ncbi:ABC transporter substrate-binding protein [Paenibacillus thermotolerans]|uniref:ABC transporter substrate-binding protein n=1 Tax=Paenibacillus thermotolerans TaxID=3027807 RepID=UPI0023676A07|nr:MULTISPECIES: extracellular solute-binding protein [unclassified Paenibacillus]
MKNMKVLSILLIVFMLALTACAGGGGGSKNNADDNGTTTETPADDSGSNVAEEEPPADEPPAMDLGGRTIRMAAWWDLKPAGNTAGEKAALEKYAELEKKYNFKFEFLNVPWDEYWDKFTTTVLAGEPFADVLIYELKRAIVPIQQGQMLPLSEFTKPTSDINNEQRLAKPLPAIGGVDYGFTTPGVSVVGLHYNRDLFKKLGLPDLQELYNNGEWTWEKFMDVAKLATRDTDNDGKLDTYGFAGWPADVARHFAAANGVSFVNPDTLEDMSNDPRMIEALEFVNRLFNVENVTKVKTGNKMDWNESNTFKDGDVAMFITYDWNIGDLTFEPGVVPVPLGPSGDPKFTHARPDLNGWFIPKGVKDPQVVYQIFEEMRDLPPTEEYMGQDWLESRYKTEEDIKMALEHINGTGLVAIEESVPEYPFYTIMDEIIVQNKSVTAAVEGNKQKAEAAVAGIK